MTAAPGLLLVNLGTPAAPTAAAVRPYLREFLMDPRVVDLSGPARFLLVEGAILPTRPAKTAAAYATIWTERGSPLLFHSQDLTEKVRARLPGVPVELGMRYGAPSIESALQRLLGRGVDRVCMFPLYPQHSAAATGSCVEELFRAARTLWAVPSLHVVPAFYDAPSFLDLFAEKGAEALRGYDADHVVMSFHGIPEHHVTKCDPSGRHCLQRADCCDVDVPENALCYRRHCTVTARGIAARMGLAPDRWTMTFQSRLGRRPWLKPYTDLVLPELAKAGKKRLLVFSPAFVADCLETLEEIRVRAKEDFVRAGGEDLRLVPSLNADDGWADAVVALARASCGWLADARTAA